MADEVIRKGLRLLNSGAWETLSDDEFALMGQAWYKENLRRHSLLQENDFEVFDFEASTEPCDCIRDCSCIEISDGVEKDCTLCEGWRDVADPNCPNCHGNKFIFLLANKNLSHEEYGQLLEKIDNVRTSLLKDNFAEAFPIHDYSLNRYPGLFKFLSQAIAKLGGKLIISKEVYNIVVSYPKFLLTKPANEAAASTLNPSNKR